MSAAAERLAEAAAPPAIATASAGESSRRTPPPSVSRSWITSLPVDSSISKWTSWPSLRSASTWRTAASTSFQTLIGG